MQNNRKKHPLIIAAEAEHNAFRKDEKLLKVWTDYIEEYKNIERDDFDAALSGTTSNKVTGVLLQRVFLPNIEFNAGLERVVNAKMNITATKDEKETREIWKDVKEWKNKFKGELQFLRPTYLAFERFKDLTLAYNNLKDDHVGKLQLKVNRKINDLYMKNSLTDVEEGRLKVLQNIEAALNKGSAEIAELKIEENTAVGVFNELVSKDKDILNDLLVLKEAQDIYSGKKELMDKGIRDKDELKDKIQKVQKSKVNLRIAHSCCNDTTQMAVLNQNPELERLNKMFRAIQTLDDLAKIAPEEIKFNEGQSRPQAKKQGLMSFKLFSTKGAQSKSTVPVEVKNKVTI